MAIADRNGLPIAVGIANGPSHEATLVLETLGQRFVRGPLVRLIGDKAYDSNPLDAQLAAKGIDMIAPNHVTRTVQSVAKMICVFYRGENMRAVAKRPLGPTPEATHVL